MATHELGGLHMVADMQTKYSAKQLFDMLEILDVHDSIKKAAHDQVVAQTQ